MNNNNNEKLTIDDIGYIEEMRKRLELDPEDTSCDADILAMSPMERVRLIAGWYHGSESWADTWKEYFESQGIWLTTNPDADGVIHDGDDY